MINRAIAAARFVTLLAVVAMLIAATALAVYGLLLTLQIIWHVLREFRLSEEIARDLAVEFIEVVDLLLLSTVLYVIGAGLYQLFIDDNLPLPSWLKVTDLDELKERLVTVVIVVLGVSFAGEVTAWDGERDLQPFGIATAAVLIALTYFLSQRAKHHRPPD